MTAPHDPDAPVRKRYDDDYYTRRLELPWYGAARGLAHAIYAEWRPDSVIDLGCAVGVYLDYLAAQGVTVHGVDGHPAAIDHAVVDSIERHDLRDPYYPDREWDLALCIEVAEHLHDQHAGTLIDSVGRCAPTVVFTAAQPGQDGQHHVNCRPRSYWREQFATRGYTFDRDTTDRLRQSMTPTHLDWVPRNLFVFREES